MNISFSINKDFGELTDKKIERISSSFGEQLQSTQNIENQVAIFNFNDGAALVLNKHNNEVASVFQYLESLTEQFERFISILGLLDLDNIGLSQITIENVEDYDFSIAESTKEIMNLTDEADGVGFRYLIDSFTDAPKEIKIEPKIDDFNKLYISCAQGQRVEHELTKEFLEKSITYLLDKTEEYKQSFLEKGGLSGQ